MHARIAAFAATAILVVACATPPTATPTLYDRLGGERVVRVIVDDVVDRSASDPRTARSFKDTKLSRVKEKLAEQICELSGGPCKYTGDPMREVHKGLKNTDAEFNLMVQFVRDALDRNGVRDREKNELLRLLAPMKRDIVSG